MKNYSSVFNMLGVAQVIMNKMKYRKKINYSKAREGFEKLKATQKAQVHKALAVSICLIFRLSKPLLRLPDRCDRREGW